MPNRSLSIWDRVQMDRQERLRNYCENNQDVMREYFSKIGRGSGWWTHQRKPEFRTCVIPKVNHYLTVQLVYVTQLFSS